MADKAQTPEVISGDEPTPTPPKRSPGHRGTDVRDAVAEMTARAHEISLEAGSKMASALKDVVNAAAGLAGFAIESTRDLVQYMVRRGQMTQDEADKLLRDAEEAQSRRKGGAAPIADVEREVAAVRAEPRIRPPEPRALDPVVPVTVVPPAPPAAPLTAPSAAPPAAKKAAAKEPAAREPVAKSAKPAARQPAAKAATKAAAKPHAKAADKSGSAKKASTSKGSAKAPAKAQSKKPAGKRK
jgi:polyhydroxyalkanoate synthesis regulator phasin